MMFHWAAAFVLVLLLVSGCLSGMGVGMNTLLRLLLAVGLMTLVAFLIAWPFLRSRTKW